MTRPILHLTAEDRRAARKTYKKKWKSVSIDSDLVAMLNDVADRMEPEMGFRPTLSQTVRRLLRDFLKEG